MEIDIKMVAASGSRGRLTGKGPGEVSGIMMKFFVSTGVLVTMAINDYF